MRCQVFFLSAGTAHELSTRVATMPSLLLHTAGNQAVARPALRRCRPGAALLPGPTYDEYAARGESENRNKEFKCDLAMDRLSEHRFVANYFRLYLHAAAMNLLVRLRRGV
jgi:Transposase DDE domain group 1